MLSTAVAAAMRPFAVSSAATCCYAEPVKLHGGGVCGFACSTVVWRKAVTRGVFWVFEHPQNFREKIETQKQIYY